GLGLLTDRQRFGILAKLHEADDEALIGYNLVREGAGLERVFLGLGPDEFYQVNGFPVSRGGLLPLSLEAVCGPNAPVTAQSRLRVADGLEHLETRPVLRKRFRIAAHGAIDEAGVDNVFRQPQLIAQGAQDLRAGLVLPQGFRISTRRPIRIP